MTWQRKLYRFLTNRFALSAVLFLLVITVGAFSALFGVVDSKTACAGYALPTLVKADPTRPHGQPVAAPLAARALNTPAPVASWAERVTKKTAAAESAVQTALTDQHTLIQLYGAFQAFTDRTVVEDTADPTYSVVRLDSGTLAFTVDSASRPAAQAATLKRLQHALDTRNISLLYLQAPAKMAPGNDVLPYGVADSGNQNADALLRLLEEKDIDCLDFRQTLLDAGGDWPDWFYTTDHHWNQEAAFTAFRALCGKLTDYDQTSTVSRGTKRRPITIDEKWTQRESYDITTVPSSFLGSQGKRVGSFYAGLDDFDLWTPKYPTLLRYTATNPASHGGAEDTVLFPVRLEETDPFKGNLYTYYAGGDYGYTTITNYYNPQGPRILLVRDSYACAITPYLAYSCSELIIIDPRYFHGNFLQQVDWTAPDVVLVMYSPGTLRTDTAFSFLSQPDPPSKSDALRWLAD